MDIWLKDGAEDDDGVREDAMVTFEGTVRMNVDETAYHCEGTWNLRNWYIAGKRDDVEEVIGGQLQEPLDVQ